MAFDTEQTEESRSVLSRVLGWLSAGYPEGIPPTDRFAVIALLRRRLTDEQVRAIVAELTAKESPAGANGVISRDEVEQLIGRVLHEQPSEGDIRRVSACLAAGGWPLAARNDPQVDGQSGAV